MILFKLLGVPQTVKTLTCFYWKLNDMFHNVLKQIVKMSLLDARDVQRFLTTIMSNYIGAEYFKHKK
jgi:hypothetical protein